MSSSIEAVGPIAWDVHRSSHERITRAHRPRALSRKRGAAFVESLIVIGMITLFLGSMSYFFYLYYGKWSAAQEARFSAWSSALDGCMSKGEYDKMFADAKADPGGTEDEIAGLSTDSDQPPSWMDLELGGEASAKRKVGDIDLTVVRDVSCNEKQEENELTFQGAGIIGAVASSAVDLLGF